MRRWIPLIGTVLGAVSCGSIVVIDAEDINPAGGAGGASGGLTTGAHSTGSYGGSNSGSSSAKAGSGTVTASASSGGNPGSVTCAQYCKEIMANCTGESQQYPDETTCTTVCATFPVGKPSPTAPPQENTLTCRAYHASAPSKMAPKTHCPHAGPTGGDVDPSATGGPFDGPCGDGVDAFCHLAIATCAGANQVWASFDACRSDAKNFPKSMNPYSTSDVSGNDFGCRMYHLTVASQSKSSAPVHCPHIRLDSLICK